MNAIERIARDLESSPSASDMEDICRSEVAGIIRESKRLLTADEVEDIVDDVVADEAIAEPEVSDDGVIEMSELEWDNVPDEEKVKVDEGGDIVEGMVVAGMFRPVALHKDYRPKHIASNISKHIESLARLAATNDGIDYRSMFNPVPDVVMPCPKCASRDVTPVWYDAGEVVACCNHCGNEFHAGIDDVAHATLAERTVEDIDILPEHNVFGSVWCNDNGNFGWEIYASGDLIDSGESESFEVIQDRFDDIADAYDEISEDTVIDLDNGSDEKIVEINGDEITMESGRSASRIRIARMVADRKAFIDNSHVQTMRVHIGSVYSTADGASVIVSSVEPDGIYASVIRCGSDGAVHEDFVRFSEREFADIVK